MLRVSTLRKSNFKGVLQTMQKTGFKKSLSLLLCIVLIAAMALCTTGCKDNQLDGSSDNQLGTSDVSQNDGNILGKGQTKFNFVVTDGDGKETRYEIHTDKTTVGDALLELELIAGDESAYGLYVKTVNGITADYDVDKTYWAFYVNGEYATTGVDSTEITEGATYAFKVEKG